jgi:hypothetical protein
MRMRELIVFADVTLDGFMAGDEGLDQVLCADSVPQ